MPIIQPDFTQNDNVAQAPTMGSTLGSVLTSGGQQQKRNVSQKGSGFTNLQQYVQANQNNANPNLIRQRQEQAQTGLSQAQGQFGNVAQTAKSGLEGIQGVQNFVGNVLSNPTQSVSTPETLQRFTALRTGSENIANPTNIYQNYLTGKSGLQSQQQQLASGLTTDITGTGLQNYLRSRRSNPELATQGETQLDRFLAEATPTGQLALQTAQQKATEIQSSVIPTIGTQVEQLRTSLGTPAYLTKESIQQAINQPAQSEQDYLRNLNNLYVAQQVGLGAPSSGERVQFNDVNKVLSIPDLTYVRPENLGTATQEKIDEAKRQTDIYNQFQSELAQNEGIKQLRLNRLVEIEAMSRNPASLITDQINYKLEADRLRNDLDTLNKQKNQLLLKYNGIGVNAIPVYQEYLNKLGNTRQQLLSQYDPEKLARINALSQLSGIDYSNLLGSKI